MEIIMDSRWKEELEKYKTIKLLPVGNCEKLCEEIRHRLPSSKFVDGEEEGGEEVTVVVIVKTTRVQSDAEMALEHTKIGADEGHKAILMMFHSIVGSKTIEDIQSVMYNHPNLLRTFHVPFKRNW